MTFYHIFMVVLLIVYVLQWRAVRAACRKEDEKSWKYRIMAHKLRLSERARKRLANQIIGEKPKGSNCERKRK